MAVLRTSRPASRRKRELFGRFRHEVVAASERRDPCAIDVNGSFQEGALYA